MFVTLLEGETSLHWASTVVEWSMPVTAMAGETDGDVQSSEVEREDCRERSVSGSGVA